MSHLLHDQQASLTDPHYEALRSEVARARDMGCPAKAPGQIVAHRAAGGAQCASLADSEQRLRHAAAGGAVALDVDTFRSKIPMKWAAGGTWPASAYSVRG